MSVAQEITYTMSVAQETNNAKKKLGFLYFVSCLTSAIFFPQKIVKLTNWRHSPCVCRRIDDELRHNIVQLYSQ